MSKDKERNGKGDSRQPWSQEARTRHSATLKASWEKRNALKAAKGAGPGEPNPKPTEQLPESPSTPPGVIPRSETEESVPDAAERSVSEVVHPAASERMSQSQLVVPQVGKTGNGASSENVASTSSDLALVATAVIAPTGAIHLTTDEPAGSIETMEEGQLDILIARLWAGFKRNRLALAVALHEKKLRLSRPGRNGEWSRFLRLSAIPRTSADRLVHGFELYLKISPVLRTAAEKAKIDLLQPAAVSLIENLEAVAFDLEEAPAKEEIDRWVELLKTATSRRPLLNSETGGDRPDEEEGKEDKEQRLAKRSTGGGNKEDKHPVTLAFTAAELRKFKLLRQKCADAFDLENNEEIILEALRVAAGDSPAGGA